MLKPQDTCTCSFLWCLEGLAPQHCLRVHPAGPRRATLADVALQSRHGAWLSEVRALVGLHKWPDYRPRRSHPGGQPVPTRWPPWSFSALDVGDPVACDWSKPLSKGVWREKGDGSFSKPPTLGPSGPGCARPRDSHGTRGGGLGLEQLGRGVGSTSSAVLCQVVLRADAPGGSRTPPPPATGRRAKGLLPGDTRRKLPVPGARSRVADAARGEKLGFNGNPPAVAWPPGSPGGRAPTEPASPLPFGGVRG